MWVRLRYQETFQSKYQQRPKLQLVPRHDGWPKHPGLPHLHWDSEDTALLWKLSCNRVTASEHMIFPNLIWLSSSTGYAPTEILQLNLVTKEIQELQETLTLYRVTEDFFFSCLQKESRSSKKHKEYKEQAVISIDSSTNKHLCLNTFLIWAPVVLGSSSSAPSCHEV